MPDFRLQPSFPIASVIDAAGRNAQLQEQAREAGNKSLIEGLRSIGQVGQSLYDQKKRVAQSLAIGKTLGIDENLARTLTADQSLAVGGILHKGADIDLLMKLHDQMMGNKPAATVAATPAIPAAPPSPIQPGASSAINHNADLASISPTIPGAAPTAPPAMPFGGASTPTAPSPVPVPIAAPPISPRMNPATVSLAKSMGLFTPDEKVMSQSDALKAGSVPKGTRIVNPATGTGQVTWETANPQQQSLARAMYEGRVRPSDIGFRERGAMTALANEYATANGLPPYKSFNAEVNATMAKYSTSGKLGQNALSLNTALGHASSAYDSYKALGNTNQEWLNVPINKLKQKTNDPNVVALGINLNALRGELSNVFKNTGGTDQEIASWKEYLNEDLTPSQTIAAMTKVDELLRSRLDAMEFQKSQAGGGEAPLISPHAKKISQDLQNPDNAAVPAVGGTFNGGKVLSVKRIK